MGQTQYFKSYIRWNIAGTYYYIPAIPGAVLNCPVNYIVPPVIGSIVPVNYCIGLRVPVLDVGLVHLDGYHAYGTISPLSNLFLSYLFNRVTIYLDSPYFGSDPTTQGIEFWDGNSGFTLTGAKSEAMAIMVAKGTDLVMQSRFVGNGIAPITSPTSTYNWSNNQPLRFQALTFSSPLTNIPWSLEFSYQNNHRPVRQIIGGTPFPYAMVAKEPSAHINLITQTADGATVPSSGPVSFTISGASASATITGINCLDNTVDNREVRIPRVMRQHQLIVLGNSGYISPCTYSSSF